MMRIVFAFSVAMTLFITTECIALQQSVTGADISAFINGFSSCSTEMAPVHLPCTIPQDFPSGTYYRNGHGRFEADDGTKTAHSFDGDGLMIGITFDPQRQRILFRNRFVRTEGYINDKATGAMTQRGIFGTKRSGGILRNAFRTEFKNVANTNALYHSGKLYALWEAGRPFQIHPLTLETISGQKGDDLGGLLKTFKEFSAHPRYDPDNEVWVNFGNVFDPVSMTTKVRLFEISTNFHSHRSDDVSFTFNGIGLIHDFLITKNWHIFAVNAATLDPKRALKALLGIGSFAGAIECEDNVKETSIVLIPRLKHLRKGTFSNMPMMMDERIRVIPVPFHRNFHFSNAFEDGENNIIFDTVQYDFDVLTATTEMSDLDDFFGNKEESTKLVRYNLDIKQKCMSCPPQILSNRSPELPIIPRELSSKRHRFIYSTGSHKNTDHLGPPGSTLKIDSDDPESMECFIFQPFEFPQEPMFIPKCNADISKEEDCGYLIQLVVNGKDLSSDLVIFDVEGKGSLEKGPVSRSTLPVFIPHGLHGTFVQGLTF